ncbi:MAG: VOC family protein [Methylobacteriaceae bacterium]|nr:VOC family protein [Methylobacteriaceae bacterium]
MKTNPYLIFNGTCAAAFEFYKRALGATAVSMTTFGESPMADQVQANWRDKVIHARLQIGDVVVMASDSTPDRYQKPSGYSLTLSFEESAEAERAFQALSENGNVQMPLQETFWARRFGSVTDQFGTPWMINREKPR